jgi:hypothetical protein
VTPRAVAMLAGLVGCTGELEGAPPAKPGMSAPDMDAPESEQSEEPSEEEEAEATKSEPPAEASE